MRTLHLLGLALGLLGVTSVATAQDGGINLSQSEYRLWRNLPLTGAAERTPWVGYWWAYSDNGIASEYHSGEASPAEKFDRATGLQTDMTALRARIEAMRTTVHPLENEKRDLVRTINQMIGRGEDYRHCDEAPACIRGAETCSCTWNRYQEIDVLVTAAEAALPAANVNSVAGFEHMNHGNGVAGVEGWWGHCNAWSAAAILEPEPVREAMFAGTNWHVGDVKALLTESYMDVNSAFYGSRVGENNSGLSEPAARRARELVGEGKSDREITTTLRSEFADQPASSVQEYLSYFRSWNDVTPTDFQILFSTYLGKLHRSFVIDRFTGSEVWNQPVSRFESHVVRELSRTTEGLYPILMEAKFEWATDGVEPDETNESVGATGFHDRTVTYTLYLDKPLSNPDARLVGDGKWEHAAAAGDHAHPDFIWVPTSNEAASRRSDGSYYENPFVDVKWVETNLLPLMTAEATAPTRTELTASAAPRAALRDNGNLANSLSLAGAGNVASVQVSVDITHGRRSDLRLVLKHGDREVTLYNHTGGGRRNLKTEFTVDGFNGVAAAGEWTLTVYDDVRGSTGTLRSWSLNVLAE